jgi:hypothetical protein
MKSTLIFALCAFSATLLAPSALMAEATARPTAASASDHANAGLSRQETNKLQAATRGVAKNPKVVAAREAMRAASTQEEKKLAQQAMNDAVHQAILERDPSMRPLVEKSKKADEARAKNAKAAAAKPAKVDEKKDAKVK